MSEDIMNLDLRLKVIEDKASRCDLNMGVVKEFKKQTAIVENKIDNTHTKLDKLSEDLSKVSKLLFGNGEIGLCEKVRNNTEKINKTNAFWGKLGTGISLATVLAILGWVFVQIGLK